MALRPSKPPSPSLSSPFQPFFGTNYIPSCDDVKHIRSLVAAEKAKLVITWSKIAYFQSQILQLKQGESARIEFLKQHVALLSPIRRIPPEILQEIFYHCCHPVATVSMHKDDPPISLTHVCRRWREVALRSPRLWSSIHISIPTEHPSTAAPLIQRRIMGVREMLSRAGLRPLDITIYQGPPLPAQFNMDASLANQTARNAMDQIVDVIRPLSHRWRKLFLTIPLHTFQAFFDIPVSELGSLTEIGLDLNSQYLPVPDLSVQDAGSSIARCGVFHGPSLTMVTLGNLPPREAYLSYNLNWRQLTHLTIKGSSCSQDWSPYLHLFSTIQKTIESLRLSLSLRPFVPSPVETQTIHFSRLKHLFIKETHTPCPFFGQLVRLPLLETLEYHEAFAPMWFLPQGGQQMTATANPPSCPDGSFATLLAHSGALIKSLAFSPHLYNTEQIMRYLGSVPVLETLRLIPLGYGPPMLLTKPPAADYGSILKAFVTPRAESGGSPICPLLQHLGWSRTPRTGFTEEEVLFFIEEKQKGTLEGVKKLRRLAIHLKALTSPPQEFYQRVGTLIPGKGMAGVTVEPVQASTQSIRAGRFASFSLSPPISL